MRYGPRPYEALISDVCEAFHCTPDVAERQDYYTVQRIFQWRNAKAAVDLYRSGKRGSEALAKTPALAQILVDLRKAQFSDDIPAEAVRRAIDDEMQQMNRNDEDGITR